MEKKGLSGTNIAFPDRSMRRGNEERRLPRTEEAMPHGKDDYLDRNLAGDLGGSPGIAVAPYPDSAAIASEAIPADRSGRLKGS